MTISKLYLISILNFCLFLPLLGLAQRQQDFNLLTQINLNKKFRHGWAAHLSMRAFFTENVSEWNSWFLEAGTSYKLSENIKLGAYYRFKDERRRNNVFEEQYRWYVDAAYETPNFKQFSLSYRARYQNQTSGQMIGDTDHPSWHLFRQKIGLSYRYNWYWSAGLNTEFFTDLRTRQWLSQRNSISLAYRHNLHNAFQLSFQHRMPLIQPATTRWVLGLQYDWTW